MRLLLRGAISCLAIVMSSIGCTTEYASFTLQDAGSTGSGSAGSAAGGAGGAPSGSSATAVGAGASVTVGASAGGGPSGGTTTGSGGSGTGASGGVGCGGPGGTNLLPNGDMEEGIVPPSGAEWEAFQSGLAEDMQNVHGGARAIEVCETSGVSDFTSYIDVISNGNFDGDTFSATACVRASPGKATPTTLHLMLREQNPWPHTDYDGPDAAPLTDQWQEISVTATMSNMDNKLMVLLLWGEHSGDGACFLMDDAWVVQE